MHSWETGRLYDECMVNLLLALALLMPLHAQFEPRIDFQREFSTPTITSIGPVDLMLGEPPKVHVHIQHGSTQYVCSFDSEEKAKTSGFKAGERVELREDGKYLEVREQGRQKWVKLRLVSRVVLHNL